MKNNLIYFLPILLFSGCKDFSRIIDQVPSAVQTYRQERERLKNESYQTNNVVSGSFRLLSLEGMTNSYQDIYFNLNRTK